MTTMDATREIVAKHFKNVIKVDEMVLRGEKQYNDKCYAIAYVDFADDVVARAECLREFQEQILGADFFQSPEQLRWNNYLYLVAGPKSVGSDGFLDAKWRIEADKDYARKRVVSEAELIEILGDSKLFDAKRADGDNDIVGVWEEKLSKAGLDTLLDQPSPRTAVLESIAAGTAAGQIKPRKIKTLTQQDFVFTRSWLSKLSVTRFRSVHDGRSYSFGAVTLIVGPNGTGKTSLLEAIEHLYCGHTRRPSSNVGVHIEGSFTDYESGVMTSLASVSDSSRITARCLSWYGRAERQGKAILDAFTKYNFLDTDAAFRLSTELKPGDISEDLSRLLIGAEAATLWDYLNKLSSALEVEWNKSIQQIEREAERVTHLEQEIVQMKSAPTLAKSLSITYRAALKQIGWSGPLSVTDDVVSSSERASLEVLASEINGLTTSRVAYLNTLANVRHRLLEITNFIEAQRPVENSRLKTKAKVANISLLVEQINSQVQILSEWLNFCVSGFSKEIELLEAKKLEVGALRTRLGKYISSALSVDERFVNVSLTVAEAIVSEVLKANSTVVAQLESTQRNFNLAEAKIAQASQQLHDAALQFVLLGLEDACPVCGTSHEIGTLRNKISEITSRGTSSEPMQELQRQLASSRQLVEDAKRDQKNLLELRAIATQLNINDLMQVHDIIAEFERVKREFADVSSAVAEGQERIRSFEEQGLTQLKFAFLRSKVMAMLPEDAIDDVSWVKEVHSNLNLKKKDLEKELAVVDFELAQTCDAIEEAISNFRNSLSLEPTDEYLTWDLLQEMVAEVEDILLRAEHVASKVELHPHVKFSELQSSVRAILAAFDQALHAAHEEASAASSVAGKEDDLRLYLHNLNALRAASANQRRALDVLDELRRNSSLEKATSSALESIREQINDVFGRIHSPSEYEYDGTGAAILRAKESLVPRTLNEVSTGQRAAFALAIFLALNLTAKSAPPIVLIDDPIAHIDDLNALSFMDYLRDLAVNSRRQIFFATADTRVATLFEKKFAFLGDEKFKKIELSKRATS